MKALQNEAKVIQLYPDTHSSSNGSFTCPAVALIHSLSAEVKSLRILIDNQNPKTSQKLDNADLLREYNISRGTATNWRNAGLEYVKVGSKIFYDRRKVESFLQQYNVKAF